MQSLQGRCVANNLGQSLDGVKISL